jgi:hypothetical protein
MNNIYTFKRLVIHPDEAGLFRRAAPNVKQDSLLRCDDRQGNLQMVLREAD